MRAPTVHLNGTSKESLLEAIEGAFNAVSDAADKLTEVAPNGRDYYVQGPSAYGEARDAYDKWQHSLRTILSGLSDLAAAIADQGRRT